jgi:hypothetical protein
MMNGIFTRMLRTFMIGVNPDALTCLSGFSPRDLEDARLAKFV